MNRPAANTNALFRHRGDAGETTKNQNKGQHMSWSIKSIIPVAHAAAVLARENYKYLPQPLKDSIVHIANEIINSNDPNAPKAIEVESSGYISGSYSNVNNFSVKPEGKFTVEEPPLAAPDFTPPPPPDFTPAPPPATAEVPPLTQQDTAAAPPVDNAHVE